VRSVNSRIRWLALACAAFAALILVGHLMGNLPGAFPLAATGLILAASIWLSPRISSFLRIFVAIFAVEYIVFGTVVLAARSGAWPSALAGFVPPSSLPMTVGIFGILVVAVSYIPVIRTITGIADRYFETDQTGTARVWPFGTWGGLERRLATAAVVFLVLVNQAQVAISVRLSFFNRDWFNAIQQKDEASFWSLLYTVFLVWALVYIISAVVEYVVQSTLLIRWRRWLTGQYVSDWLDDGTHYRMGFSGERADNPDQRIAEDIQKFTDTTYSLSIQLLSQISTLVSFSIILWTISADFRLPGTDIVVPGLLFWIALAYAVLGTGITHLIGRKLIPLFFNQQRFEADFRFSLARLREYGEQVALLEGEPTERRILRGRFDTVVENFFRIVNRRKFLMMFTAFYGQISVIIPYVVAAPFYFLGRVQLGTLTQTAGAFARVESSLSFFVDRYVALADFKAVVDRLSTFDLAIAQGKLLGRTEPRIAIGEQASERLTIGDLSLSLPDGRTIVRVGELSLRPGETTLFTGPSGSGKSTLFRAIAGIWPFGAGRILTPSGSSMMLLPQRPYIPIGTLRAAVLYPASEGAYSDEAVREALVAAKLAPFVERLDEERAWAQTLSLGEQQRLAIARALLARPDWLFLDEATAALDEPTEVEIYRVLAEALPNTTVVSIGHRSTLIAFHERRIDMRPGAGGVFTPVDISPEPIPAE
jgi:vitamin B12/bleomycin/antimicrobial peptide transport system ATP-binding/permease protein